MSVPARTGRTRRLLLAAAVAVALALIAVAFDVTRFAQAHDDRLLPGSHAAGVDLAGLTVEEAEEAVADAITPAEELQVRLAAGGAEVRATAGELGATADPAELVAPAAQASEAADWVDLARVRLLGDDLGVRTEPELAADAERIAELVDQLAGEVDRDPRDAELAWPDGRLEVREHQNGREVDRDDAAERLAAAIDDGLTTARTAPSQVEPVAVDAEVSHQRPEVTAEDFRQVLFLQVGSRRLHLYEDGERRASWTVAVGQPSSPTPAGVFEVGQLRHLPTWRNPAPDGWGADMPEVIGPGPSNPLGTRAINWAGTLIRFHGTSDLGSIGRASSQGCVRLTNPDVEQLYDMVEPGATIVSTHT